MTNNLKDELDKILKQFGEDYPMPYRYMKDNDKSPAEQEEGAREKLFEETTSAISALINQKEKELLEKVEALDSLREQNTHWSACNNHGKGRPNYKCVCPAEPQNELRTEIKDRIKQLKEELNKETK